MKGDRMTLEELKKHAYELIVVHAGNSFLGTASMLNEKNELIPVPRGSAEGKGWNNQEMETIGTLLVLNAFPIAGTQTPQGPVPALGTLHWLVLEGVQRLWVRPLWYYWVSEIGEASQKEFYNAYVKHQENIEEMRFFKGIADSGLIMASPGDIARAEATARKMGFPTLQEAMNAVKGPTPQP
jgi:hypothetical protein